MNMIFFLLLSIFAVSHGDYYKSPGVVANAEGGDNLYNLSREIGLSLEIVKPADQKIDLSEADIRTKIEDIFQNARLKEGAPKIENSRNYPFLHYLIMIVPIEKGYTAYVAGRIFEDVNVKRIFLDKDVFFQAVTWENQYLLVSSSADLKNEILKAVEKITKQFLSRYNYFRSLNK